MPLRNGKRQVRREDVPQGAILCDYCPAKCCKYLALPLTKNPRTWNDYDEVRWFLAHENISIFVEDGDWYILIYNVCNHLQKDNRCGIYHTRPKICRDYSTENCEYDDDFCYDKLFEHDDQITEYAEALLGPKPGSLPGVTING